MRAVVIDDEEGARKVLYDIVSTSCPEVQIVGQADSVKTAVETIQQQQPDLIFLDIQMPSGSGFDVLEQFDQPGFAVIFTTAYQQYAIKAIKFSALDYLLKPITPEDVIEAVKRAVEQKNRAPTGQNMKVLAEHLRQQPSRIALPSSDGLIIVELASIVRCEGDKNYTTFHLNTGNKIIVSKTLKEYDDLLTDHNFLRVFKSHLVNLSHVVKYIKGRGGQVELADGVSVPVSREKRDVVLERLAKLL